MSLNLKIRSEEFKTVRWLVILFASLLVAFTGCERRAITYYLESEIGINADWTLSCLGEGEEGFGATTVFFAQELLDSKHLLMGVRETGQVRLPEGAYHTVIFNRSPDGFASIFFTGDAFENYSAAARQVETRVDPQTRATTRVIIATPEELAVDVVTNVRVTESMLGNYSDSEVIARRSGSTKGVNGTEKNSYYVVNFTPLKLTRKVKVQIHFEGINNLRSAIGSITGVSESVLLGTAQASPTTAIQQFSLIDIAYDTGSPFNGVLSGEFNVFGFDMERKQTLSLNLLLVDNKTYVEQFLQVRAENVTDENGEIIIFIKIDSPQRLPDVQPEGEPNSGFDASVDEWGDPEEAEIPLQ